jgi:CBS domain-containing protein
MRRLTVGDVMTAEVITVRVDAPFKEVARVLEEHNVSALPVLDDAGHLVGVVSEADLLPKEEYRNQQGQPGRLERIAHRHELAKAAGDVAGELMTSPAVTIGPDATLADAARRIVNERVKRLPVTTESGDLIGIVSRADLVDAFLRPDQAIAREVEDEISERILLTEIGTVQVKVDDGVVTLTGHLDRKSSGEITKNLARAVDGVVDVKSELSYRWDDSKLAR